MKKLALSAITMFVMTASAVTLHNGRMQAFTSTPELATNAAYRDGLYLGKLEAEHGSQPQPATARWARAEDRASFTAGYEQSYKAVAASRTTELNQAQR